MKKIVACLLLALLCLSLGAKKDAPKPVYVFGFASSFVDTVAFFTAVQPLDSVKLTKEKFLPQRTFYSYQLKSYIEGHSLQQNSTTMIYFSRSRKKIDKSRRKMVEKYRKNTSCNVVFIGAKEFSFTKPLDE